MDNIQKVLDVHGLGMQAAMGQMTDENAVKVLRLKQFLKENGLSISPICETGYEKIGIYNANGYLICKNSVGL